MNPDVKDAIIYGMQDHLEKLEQDYEKLIEQIRIANQHQFGRQTEKLDGPLSFSTKQRQSLKMPVKNLTLKRLFHQNQREKSKRANGIKCISLMIPSVFDGGGIDMTKRGQIISKISAIGGNHD